MKRIWLGYPVQYAAIVDDEDYDELQQFTWTYFVGNRAVYARSYGVNPGLFMHRVIMKSPPGFFVHHKDKFGLHNWRSNLELVTLREHNQRKKSHNSSGFLGVLKRGTRWRAQIVLDGVYHSLGTYATAELASAAYQNALERSKDV